MHVIGTAGHVDHGKSTLIEALSGTHPDRLKEEREREMTIDLGFAWMSLSPGGTADGEEIGIVDVPGHRDFIENMLAGIGGIEAALFVIAADEGIMPQTREHLAILDLLQIQGGIVAMTKIDLVDDPDWLDLVESEIHDAVSGTVLEHAPVVRVSARTKTGLLELKEQLRQVLASRPEKLDLGRPRLPVDRVFTIPGFGTVVTGTLQDGSLRVGEEITTEPGGLRGRVRGLQTHKQKEQTAVPGSRTAVNISGIALEEIQRGDVVVHPGDYTPTQRIDVHFRLLPDVESSLRHNTQVKLFLGTAEVLARLRLLGTEELLPGEQGWLQLELYSPVVAQRGDRYILRRPSPGETIGGGSVVDPHPKGRHKRFAPNLIEGLESLLQGRPADILLKGIQTGGPAVLKDATNRSGLDQDTAQNALQELLISGEVIDLESEQNGLSSTENGLLISAVQWKQISGAVLHEIAEYHRSYPLRRGIPREQLKSRIKDFSKGNARLFNAILRRMVFLGTIQEAGPLVSQFGHEVRFDPQTQSQVEKLLQRFAVSEYSPPSAKECQTEIGEEAFGALLENGTLIEVAPDVVFHKTTYERMVADTRDLISKNGAITVADARDHFNTSRRYMLAFLEHLDAIGVTVRSGDARRLRRPG